jgi:hypothetical protein
LSSKKWKKFPICGYPENRPEPPKKRFSALPTPNPDFAYQHSPAVPDIRGTPVLAGKGGQTRVSRLRPESAYQSRQGAEKAPDRRIFCGNDVDKLRESGGFFRRGEPMRSPMAEIIPRLIRG